ncbi:hypothetical protein RI129_007512 [Pyrocoelia pectoralis]|uniref:Sphingomyelin phosphodiesterase n=1 Tax=Pyrocoelia pectoralis TaxID=417401 RepID=A0AAN7ZH41_9COLE
MKFETILFLFGLIASGDFFSKDEWKHFESNTALQQIYSMLDLRQMGQTNLTQNKMSCSFCETGANMLLGVAKKGYPLQLAKITVTTICYNMRIFTKEMCDGIVEVYVPTILTAFKISKLTSSAICNFLLGESCPDVHSFLYDWNVTFPNVTKPIAVKNIPQDGRPTIKVLQLADLHLDLKYVEGSNGNCYDPLCCRPFSNSAYLVLFPAGRWGHYKCDVPQKTIENMLRSIAKQHSDVEYIILSGDLVDHEVWAQTRHGTLKNLEIIIAMLKEIFPNTLVLPTLGNHDTVPCGSYAPPWLSDPNHSSIWLYEKLNVLWQNWIPSTENSTILRGGYYSHQVRPGLRVASINTNFCYYLNWWLYADSTDPADQLKWLIQVLQEAEDNDEKVHIIGHVPPGDNGCLETWSRNYYEIVNRYESTITGQFFSHTHSDEFEIFYDVNNSSRPTNIAYIGPSVTPWSGENPAYRIYYIDGDHANTTRKVVDHETWIMDLDEANNDSPQWFRLYSAKRAYNISSLGPSEWNKLIYAMVKDDRLFQLFYMHYHRDSPVIPKYNPEKKIRILCDLKSGRSRDRVNTCSDLSIDLY